MFASNPAAAADLLHIFQNTDKSSLPLTIENAINSFISLPNHSTTSISIKVIYSFGRFLRSSLTKSNVGISESSLIDMFHLITDLTNDFEFENTCDDTGVLDDFLLLLPLVASQTSEPASPGSETSAYTCALLVAFLDTLSNLTTSTEHAAKALRSDVLIHACNILEQYRVRQKATQEQCSCNDR